MWSIVLAASFFNAVIALNKQFLWVTCAINSVRVLMVTRENAILQVFRVFPSHPNCYYAGKTIEDATVFINQL